MAESFFDRVHKQDTHTPDVLSCLANLSNDEVFTPPEVVNQMLDMLPQELFASTETTFLDPACKTGVFLREIAKRLLSFQLPFYQDKMQVINDKRANGLALTVDDEIFLEKLQKTIDHIFHKQLFGIAITELTSLLSRRSLYCSKYPNGPYSITHFDDAEGNIRYRRLKHTWDKSGKCVYCGTSAKGELGENKRGEQLETHAYEWIHTLKPEEIFNMKFDVIISNPPYQLNDGGSGNGISAKPIYQHFVQQSQKLNPRYLTMIVPSRWFAGGKGLDEFRNNMLNDKHITKIVDYPKSRDCFNGVDIAGGVCYFLWERDKEDICEIITMNNEKSVSRKRELNEFDIFVRDNIGIDIIHKTLSLNETMMNNTIYTRNPFGFVSSARGSETPFPNAIKLISSGGIGYVEKNEILKNKNLIEKYKVMIGKINPDRGGVNNAIDGKMNVITKVRIVKPNEVFTETYLLLGAFDNIDEAQNCASYFSCKFTRFLISLSLSSMNISTQNFQFVPLQNFTKSWTDEELYKKYNLTQEEIDFIESTIKPMDLDGGEIDG